MMCLWIYFFRGAVQDAISNDIIFLVRNFAQTLIIYVCILALARLMFGAPRRNPELLSNTTAQPSV
jgi:hypothetical protein